LPYLLWMHVVLLLVFPWFPLSFCFLISSYKFWMSDTATWFLYNFHTVSCHPSCRLAW
jgi:hypothetical protein